jgi:S1-C subfamily serine protease
MYKRAGTITSILVIAVMLLSACSFSTIPSTKKSTTKTLSAAPMATAIPATAVPAAVAASTPVVSTQIDANPSLQNYESTLEQIYQTVNQSVVSIQVTKKVSGADLSSSLPNGFMPNQQTPDQYEHALGSGFVWDNQGYIITNNHVISDATRIVVVFSDDKQYEAKLIGSDASVDLAVVKVDAPASELHPAAIGDSKAVKVGQIVIAIGNPFGLEGTMTTGIVSAIGRSISSDLASTSSNGSYTIPDIIQTDASINPGNSGGVLVDIQGKVVGVTSAIESSSNSSAGVGFAIPSAIVWKVVPTLIQGQKYNHSWLGISGTTLTPEIAKLMNLASDQSGVLVVDVTQKGPADKAGLKGSTKTMTFEGSDLQIGGDVITAIDQQQVSQFDDIVTYLLGSTEVGQKVTLSLIRDGKPSTVDVTLEARPETIPTTQAQDNNQPSGPQQSSGVWLGITGGSLTSEINKAMNLANDTQGVLVVEVSPNSPADQAGILGGSKDFTVSGQTIKIGGDVITAIDGQSVTSVQEITQSLQNYQAGDIVNVSILRNGINADVQVTLADRPNNP